MVESQFYRNVYGGMAEGTLDVQKRHITQKGNGFFGRIIKGSLAPIIRSILPYLRDVALEGVGGLVSDLKEGRSVKEAAENSLRTTASTMMNDIAKRVKIKQSGSGVEQRKRGTKRKQPPTRGPRPKRRGLFDP